MRRYNGYLVPDDCDDFKTEPLLLEKRHPFQRDGDIAFRDHDHQYFVRGQNNYTSVTTFVHENFPHFNAPLVARKMLGGRNFPDPKRHAKYIPMLTDSDGNERTQDEVVELVLAEWERNRDECATKGTELHLHCELTFNEVPVDNATVEFQHFLRYKAHMESQGYVPYRTEPRVFTEDFLVCGSVDMLFIHRDNIGKTPLVLTLVDWKRSKEITMRNYWQSGKGVVSHLADCNGMHYSLQLNIYKFILERHYDVVIEDMHILQFHPNQSNFVDIPVEDMSSEVRAMFLVRLLKLQQQPAS